MEESHFQFISLETLTAMICMLKESEGIKYSKENGQLMLTHATMLKKSIIKVISEIDKCCQQVSDMMLKRQFHEAKGNLLTKSGDFFQLLDEITNIPGDIIIDGELLLSFVNEFEYLVEYFRDVLIMYEQLVIEMISAHINSIGIILDKVTAVKMPDSFEATFSRFSLQITNLWPMLNQIGKNIVDDTRRIIIDATYRELMYMCAPLGKSITMSIFHPTNKPLKDQKTVISQRVSSILIELRSNLKLSKANQKLSIGYFTNYNNQITNLLDQFRNRCIDEPSHFIIQLQVCLLEVIKYAAIIYCPKPFEDCNAISQGQLVLKKLESLPQDLATLDSSDPNEMVNYFGFCHSYITLLKRIECCYANQVLEYYSDPLMPVKELISSVNQHSLDDTSTVRMTALKCNTYSDNLSIVGQFVIAKSTAGLAKTLIQLSSTFDWLDTLMLPSAIAACEDHSSFLRLKIYAKIWGDCAIKFCSSLDKILDTKALIHVALLKFKEICESLSQITGESQLEINSSKSMVMRASKFAHHLLLIQQVNPFYNGSHKFSFTEALKSLSCAPKSWDGTAMIMLEAISTIEQIQGSLQMMDNFDDDAKSSTDELASFISASNFCQTSLRSEDGSVVKNMSSKYSNTSLDLTRFLSPSIYSKSVANSSKKNSLLNVEEDKDDKSVTKRNIANYNENL